MRNLRHIVSKVLFNVNFKKSPIKEQNKSNNGEGRKRIRSTSKSTSFSPKLEFCCYLCTFGVMPRQKKTPINVLRA